MIFLNTNKYISIIFFLVFSFCFSLSDLAQAGRSRLIALSNSEHLLDEQSVFTNPLKLNYLDQAVVVESGDTDASSASTSTSGSEANVIYKNKSDMTYMLAFGHKDEAAVFSRKFINGFSYTFEQMHNPIHFIYGLKTEDLNHVYGFSYSKLNDKQGSVSEDSISLIYGVEIGPWQMYAKSFLLNKAEYGAQEFTGSGHLNLGLHYIGTASVIYVKFNRHGAMAQTSGAEVERHTVQNLTVGLSDLSTRNENDFFWGLELVSVKADCHVKSALSCGEAFESATLPVWFGFEAQASKRLVVRGSIKQFLLINQTRDAVGYPSSSLDGATGTTSQFIVGPNSTAVNLGLGFNFGDVVVDGLLAAGSTQEIDQDDLLTQVSIKFNY